MFSIKEKLRIPRKLADQINLHSSNPYHSKMLYAENFAYGHQEILLKYMGLDFSTQIIGIIEHGASRPDFLEDVRSPRFIFGQKTKFWAWSNETEKLAHESGFKNVKAIGAPWLYLKNSINKAEFPVAQKQKKVLVMLSHSTGNASDVANVQIKNLRAQKLRDAIGDELATVCLHAADFCDPEARESFEEYGFNVTCVGSSLIQPPWSSSGNRERSLYTLLKLMHDHTHFVTDHYGTALIYAIDSGLEISILPEVKEYQRLDVVSSEKQDAYSHAVESEKKFLFKNFPQAINRFCEAAEFSWLSARMLGMDAMLTSNELINTLDFRENVFRYNSEVQPW